MNSAHISAVLNHLWQSTLFATAAGILVASLRKTQARTRYAVWLAASLKFLVPFAAFMALGSLVHWSTTGPVMHQQWSTAITQASQPFTNAVTLIQETPALSAPLTFSVPLLLAAVWICGFLLVTYRWLKHWRSLHAIVRAARPVPIEAPIKVFSSSALLEPSVFGIFKPVLLLPEGIEQHLSPAQLQAVYAHELCHVRRRDNLAAALHMLVEALFWFHPLVWWLEARLIEERERACDEAVLLAGNHPEDYAQSILEVCKLCLASPLACASGVSGADLKKRIEAIMTRHIGQHLSTPKKLLLGVAGALAAIAPIAIGLLNASQSQAQSTETFEVASIKPSNPATHGHTSVGFLQGRFTAEGATIAGLIAWAYNVHRFQIEGLPNWSNSERYDIQAKADDSLQVDEHRVTAAEMALLMEQRKRSLLRVQSLLAERFHLKLHRSTKELPVYALLVGKGGPKFHAAKNAEDYSKSGVSIGDGDLTATNIWMKFFADSLSGQHDVDRVVIDKTGLAQRYDLAMTWTPGRESAELPNPAEHETQANGPSLFTALQDQLGLRLVPQKGPVEVLVIDHIERPSPN